MHCLNAHWKQYTQLLILSFLTISKESYPYIQEGRCADLSDIIICFDGFKV